MFGSQGPRRAYDETAAPAGAARNHAVANLLREFDLHPPARIDAVAEAERGLGTEFPESYRALLASADGGEGPIGDESYLILWPVEESSNTTRATRLTATTRPISYLSGRTAATRSSRSAEPTGPSSPPLWIGMAPEEVHLRGSNFQEFLESFL